MVSWFGNMSLSQCSITHQPSLDRVYLTSFVVHPICQSFYKFKLNGSEAMDLCKPELEERMKVLTMSTTEEEEIGDTFAERAESYYQKRPQLLSLLQDLYNGYITLSDRYIQTLAKHKHHSRHSSQVSAVDEGFSDQEETSGVSHFDSDIESSISYQHPPHLVMPVLLAKSSMLDVDAVVAELVVRNVEYDLLMHEVGVMERRYCESSRKSELQKSLLEVLESERIVLLNENASLSYRINTLVEENKELASESVFIKRKAGELAKCVLKMREDHRVYMLHRKIEDLQAQIHGLEKRNKEYYEKLLRRDGQDGNKGKSGEGIALEVCVQMDKFRRFKWKDGNSSRKRFDGKKSPSLWKKLKNMDLLLCGTNPTCA
ncbi:kinase-interacting family protein isoform X1 [Vigna radiata var. radiata]|uniref:Kinase-interacting family protein isoform X1 n=1 Tax=Vigna radiata var. radiata TaxID=3916 RepID=A0A1S3UJ52_VIGRR|nr:kinase-interacting family protein isoform X1 [Vigna radiata var. radiata]